MRFNLNIRSKLLILFMALTLIPSAIMAGVAFLNGKDILEKNLGLKFEALASQTMAGIDNLLFSKKEDIHFWSTLDLMQDMLNDDAQGRITRFLKQMKKEHLVYAGLFCVNTQGRIIASSEPETIGRNVSGEPWYQEMRNASEAHVRDIELDSETGSFAVRFSMPVKASSDDTQVIGFLSGLLSLDELSRLTSSIKVTDQGQSESAYAVLLDGKGATVAAPDFLFKETGAHEEDPNYWKKEVSRFSRNFFSLNYQAARLALAGKDGFLVERNPAGRKWLIGYAGSNGYGDFKGLGWSVLVMQDIQVTATPSIRLRNQLLVVSLIILLPVILTGILLSRRFEVPIRELINGTRLVAQGDLSHTIQIRTGDEIEQLAGAFNRMTADLKKSRDSLLAAKEYIDNIIESMLDPLIVFDAAGKIENVNAAACTLSRYPKEELLGADINFIFTEKIYKKDAATGQWMGKNPAGGHETRLKTTAGDEVPVSISWSALHQKAFQEADGPALRGYVIVAHDITARLRMENILATMNADLIEREKVLSHTISDLKKAHEELAEREKALRRTFGDLSNAHEELKQTQNRLVQSEKLASIGQLAAGVAHEINNPVGFISNNMEILEQYLAGYTNILKMGDRVKESLAQGDLAGAKSAAEEMARIEKEINLDYIIRDTPELLRHNRKGIERIQKIVNDLRAFSREDKNVMERVQIEEVIEGILTIVHSEIKYKAKLEKDYGDTPPIECSPQRLGQVFINLIVNALQAIEGTGTIGIKTYRQDEFVYVDVRDTGKGIPQENLDKIFDPFFTTKPVGQGTGLGLSVSHEIVKKHGGEMTVRSQPDKGTTFTIKLPVDHEKGTNSDAGKPSTLVDG